MSPVKEVAQILIVEASRETAALLQEFLSIHGVIATVAHSTEVGLILIKSIRPDATICSLATPGIDGFEFAQEVRRSPEISETYLVALTGLDYVGIEDDVAAAGFDAYFRKPLGMVEFLNKFKEKFTQFNIGPTFQTPGTSDSP